VLLALGGSYQHIPVGAASLSAVDFSLFFDACYGLFEAAGRLSFPFIFVMLAINTVLGVLARFVPQINVFIIGFIFTMGFGMLAMAEMMPSFGQAMINILSLIPEVMRVARP
jgi:flagellar biosynthetic protein FliR